MVFKGLDVSISGSSAGAKTAIASVKTSLGGLQRSANSAQDSIEELGDSTTRTTSSLSALGGVAGASALSLTGLSTAGTGASASLSSLAVSAGTLTTGIVGLSAVLAPMVATLGAVAAAAAGIATAFGAIVGSGLLAFGEERAAQNREELEQINARIAGLEALQDTERGLTDAQADELEQLEEKADRVEETTTVTGALADRLGELRAEIQPLISELGEQFVPLIEDAFEAIPTLVENTIDALGPMDAFRDALRSFGRAAMDAIPNAVAALVDLGRRALPMVMDFFGALRDGAGGALDAVVGIADRVGDDFMQIGGALRDLLPELTELGVIIIEAAAPALDSLFGHLEAAIGAFNDFAQSDDAASLLERIGSVIDAIRPALDSLVDGIKSAGSALLEWVQSDEAAETIAAIREEIVPLVPRVVELAGEFKPLFSELSDNLPEIIRGMGALGDTILDIAETVAPVVVPVLSKLVDLIGDGAAYFADWVENSENAESGLTDDIESIKTAFTDTVGDITSAWDYLTGDGEESLLGDVKSELQELDTWLRETFNLEGTFEDIAGAIRSFFDDLPLVGSGGGESADTDAQSQRTGSGPSSRAGGTGMTGVATGGFVAGGGMARLHEGERVVPDAQITDRGEIGLSADSIRSALAGMSLALDGELDVSGDVATMRDVDARLRREGRRAQNRGIGE
jgi:phage-related protein